MRLTDGWMQKLSGFGGDKAVPVLFNGGFTFSYFGKPVDHMFVSQNGHITFESGEVGGRPWWAEFFKLPGIAGLRRSLSVPNDDTLGVFVSRQGSVGIVSIGVNCEL